MLLQKRAADKKTFPNVWTNSCCSHPIYNTIPSEVDSNDQIEQGYVPGIKAAAIRKLQHELGIPKESVSPEQIKYLTRIQYCAVDKDTKQGSGPAVWYWGEHEIDYILFLQADITCDPNPEEVSEIRYVTPVALSTMLEGVQGETWSPWFKLVATRPDLLATWWKDLDRTFNTDDFVDIHSIKNLVDKERAYSSLFMDSAASLSNSQPNVNVMRMNN